MSLFSSPQTIPQIPILMYHEIAVVSERQKRVRTTNPDYSLSIQKFTQQMDYLQKNAYQALTLDEFNNERLSRDHKSIIITFDDGWIDNYTHGFPILQERQLTATIFIVTSFVGQQSYLNWSQIREMHAAGISIQSHTVSHRPLALLDEVEILAELENSKKTIEDHLGTVVNFLSVPHGMVSGSVIAGARKVGYQAVCSSEPGFSHKTGNPAVLKRVNIADRYSISTFGKIARADSGAILPTIWAKKIKNSAKKLLGYNNYRKIYRLRYRIGE